MIHVVGCVGVEKTGLRGGEALVVRSDGRVFVAASRAQEELEVLGAHLDVVVGAGVVVQRVAEDVVLQVEPVPGMICITPRAICDADGALRPATLNSRDRLHAGSDRRRKPRPFR